MFVVVVLVMIGVGVIGPVVNACVGPPRDIIDPDVVVVAAGSEVLETIGRVEELDMIL